MDITPFIFIFLFVIYLTVMGVEVIENVGTMAETEDMTKAMALRKTMFWRTMLTLNCKMDSFKIRPEVIGKNTIEELREFCENWKKMAFAVDKYLRNCESKNARNKKDEPSNFKASGSETPLFQIEQGQLQLSSAMEVFKAVYRDLKKWGQGEGLKFKAKFVNEDALAWTYTHNEEFEAYLSTTKCENEKNLFLKKGFTAAEKLKTIYIELVKEKMNQKKLEKMMRKAHEQIENIWHAALELGLDWSSMCAAWEETEKIMMEKDKSKTEKDSKKETEKDSKKETEKDSKRMEFVFKQFSLTFKSCQSSKKGSPIGFDMEKYFGYKIKSQNGIDVEKLLLVGSLSNPEPVAPEFVMEKLFGYMLTATKNYYAKQKNALGLKQFMGRDSCEEAKLKVWKKVETRQNDQSKVIKKEKAELKLAV